MWAGGSGRRLRVILCNVSTADCGELASLAVSERLGPVCGRPACCVILLCYTSNSGHSVSESEPHEVSFSSAMSSSLIKKINKKRSNGISRIFS